MELVIGDSFSIKKIISDEIIMSFAEMSGDKNPIHVDEMIASKSIFGQRVAHGALINAYISMVLGMYFPGRGTIYISQNITYIKPVFVDDIIEISVIVKACIRPGRYELSTIIKNQYDNVVADGIAIVSVPKE